MAKVKRLFTKKETLKLNKLSKLLPILKWSIVIFAVIFLCYIAFTLFVINDLANLSGMSGLKEAFTMYLKGIDYDGAYSGANAILYVSIDRLLWKLLFIPIFIFLAVSEYGLSGLLKRTWSALNPLHKIGVKRAKKRPARK